MGNVSNERYACGNIYWEAVWPGQFITITRLYNFDPLKPHFHIVNSGLPRYTLFVLILLKKHRLWGSNEYPQSTFEQEYEEYQNFFFILEFSCFGMFS